MSCENFKQRSLLNSKFSDNSLFGVYLSKEKQQKIVLDKDNKFYLITNFIPIIYPALDTITYGSWSIDNNLVVLNTSDKIMSSSLTIQVEESKRNSSDSLYIEIDNPIEKIYQKYNRGSIKDVYYEVFFEPSSDDFNWVSGNLSNKFIFRKNNIDGFNVRILPNPQISWGSLYYTEFFTRFYKVKDKKSNDFKIYIPDLRTEYIAYRRFYNDYVLILDKNRLKWDGDIYIRY